MSKNANWHLKYVDDPNNSNMIKAGVGDRTRVLFLLEMLGPCKYVERRINLVVVYLL